MTAAVDVIEWGRESVRVGPWRGRPTIAEMALVPGRPVRLSPTFVRRCLDELAARGFREVVTPAVGAAERECFVGAGFAVHEELHLLAHDLVDLPEPGDTDLCL